VVALMSSVGSLVEWQMLPSYVRALPSSSEHLRAPSEQLVTTLMSSVGLLVEW
jgi:hypothetical protein